ncbi:amidohydrolase family protein [Microbulbifer variabilis]|uniref:amidohydrolase family protein n=1 Tax=Microbulbifer variabilis TaxID=266805 RepID=UPI001CFDB81C|nr:amidohydrolase family protein [Microbulbifer variabilis]
MRVDSHLHIWDLSRGDYSWINEKLPILNRSYLPDEYEPLIQKHGIERSVLIQAAETDAETDYLLALADKYNFIAGVVGWVDMASKQVGSRLNELKRNSKFLGIRPILQDMPDSNWILREKLGRCFKWLEINEKAFDALVRPRHFAALLTLSKRYPRLRIVIDHCGQPEISNKNDLFWYQGIEELALRKNIYCKLSCFPILTEIVAERLAIEPYFQHILQYFGAHRIMWGSNWPVVNLVCNFSTWFHVTNQLLSSLHVSQQEAIYGGSAQTFYKLVD